jgi:hypothetical protein
MRGGGRTVLTVRRTASNGIGVERTFLMRFPHRESNHRASRQDCFAQGFFVAVLARVPVLNKSFLIGTSLRVRPHKHEIFIGH